MLHGASGDLVQIGKGGKNLRTVAAAPCILQYYPICSRSRSVYFLYGTSPLFFVTLETPFFTAFKSARPGCVSSFWTSRVIETSCNSWVPLIWFEATSLIFVQRTLIRFQKSLLNRHDHLLSLYCKKIYNTHTFSIFCCVSPGTLQHYFVDLKVSYWCYKISPKERQIKVITKQLTLGN